MTYSIVARDAATGEFGVAVQSHWFAAGEIVPWAEAGVGAVATQAMPDVAYGPLGLEFMRMGKSAPDALRALRSADDGEHHRQVGMVDRDGNAAAHTGGRCIREAGHRTGEGYTVQANMMLRDTVWDAMGEGFEAAAGPLAYRLLAALDAAEAEGGDIRGRQAAGIVVVRAEPTGRWWEDVVIRTRVDDNPEPLAELRRLADLKFAYDRMDRAEELELAGDLDDALNEQRTALTAYPDNAEFAFWSAISMATQGRTDEARRTMAVALAEHPGWEELLRRLSSDGFLEVSGEALEALLSPRRG